MNYVILSIGWYYNVISRPYSRSVAIPGVDTCLKYSFFSCQYFKYIIGKQFRKDIVNFVIIMVLDYI